MLEFFEFLAANMDATESCCSTCKAPFDDIITSLSQQENYWGTDSLTEQQQAFLEKIQHNTVPYHCPECMD